MKRLSLRLTIALFTFLIGVALTVVWFVKRADVSEQEVIIIAEELPANSENDEYAVYSAVIQQMFVEDRVRLIVIREMTSAYGADFPTNSSSSERVQHMQRYCPSVDENTLEDYDAKHMQSYRLNPNFRLPIRYELVSEAEVEHYSGDDGARIRFFHERYPESWGLISLSKVGFNRNRTQAFVYVEKTFCPLCGIGNYVLLSKEEGVWQIKETFLAWVS